MRNVSFLFIFSNLFDQLHAIFMHPSGTISFASLPLHIYCCCSRQQLSLDVNVCVALLLCVPAVRWKNCHYWKFLKLLRWLNYLVVLAKAIIVNHRYCILGLRDLGDKPITSSILMHNSSCTNCSFGSTWYVTLDHTTLSLKSLGYIHSNSQNCIVWVKIIDFSFMPKIIRILNKNHIPWTYFVHCLL